MEEVAAPDGDLLLVRPAPGELPLRARQDEARVLVDEQLGRAAPRVLCGVDLDSRTLGAIRSWRTAPGATPRWFSASLGILATVG